MLVQACDAFHFIDHQPGEAIGESPGLALGQIDQDVGDVGGLFGEINAADRVRLVF